MSGFVAGTRVLGGPSIVGLVRSTWPVGCKMLVIMYRKSDNLAFRPEQSGSPRDLGVVIASLIILGCDSGTTHTFKDEGRLCVYPGGDRPISPLPNGTDPQNYGAEQGLDLNVVMPDCLSSSCGLDRQAECTAAVNGSLIDVTSKASYRQQGNTCTTDCGVLVAKCSVPPLPAGAYTIRHGLTELTLTVPSMVAPPCGGTGIGGP